MYKVLTRMTFLLETSVPENVYFTPSIWKSVKIQTEKKAHHCKTNTFLTTLRI